MKGSKLPLPERYACESCKHIRVGLYQEPCLSCLAPDNTKLAHWTPTLWYKLKQGMKREDS